MRCFPHPISGAIYEELGDGLVRVDDKAKGQFGVFRFDGTWLEGSLTQADLHYLGYVGGPTLPPEKDIIWQFLPVTDPASGDLIGMPPTPASGEQPALFIAPYRPDPGKMTDQGLRSSAHIPQEFYLERDRHPERIPDVYRKAAPYPGDVKRVATDRFHKAAYHDLEVERLWKKVWQMACREDDIPEVGDHVLYRIAHLEYIIVRTAPDEVKAHVNACLHRGRKLCDHDGHKAARFRCPYHGWSWKIDGSLEDLTAEWDFPGVRAEVSRLPGVKVALWGGFVFINPDPDAISFEEYAGPEMLEHYAKYKMTNRYKQVHVGKIIKANWKLIMEAFLEAYHIITTHPQLMLFGGDLAETRYDVFGNWGRLGHVNTSYNSAHRGLYVTDEKALEGYRASADMNREYLRSLIGEEVEAYSDAELNEQTFNNLFPNFSPWGGWARIVYRFRPFNDNPNECLMDVMLLAPWAEGKPKPPPAKMRLLQADEPWVAAEELGMLARIFDQDCGNVPQTHEGLKTKEPPHVIYSAYQESIIRRFHDTYERYLGLKDGE